MSEAPSSRVAKPKRCDWSSSGTRLPGTRKNRKSVRPDIKKKKISAAGNRHRKKSDDLSELSAEQQDQLLAEAYAGTVLVGWKGLTIGGKNIAYSDENAQDLLFNNDTFRNFVAEEASDFDEFLQEDKDTTAKKSATPTAGG